MKMSGFTEYLPVNLKAFFFTKMILYCRQTHVKEFKLWKRKININTQFLVQLFFSLKHCFRKQDTD